MRVTAFTKYGSMAASTRQRVLQYIPYLQSVGIEVEYHPLLGDDYVQNIATGSGFSRARLARSYLRRLWQLAAKPKSDVLWIYAELFPYLPAMFERLAFRSGVPIVYDFDDAFFHVYDSNERPSIRKLLGGKLQPLMRKSFVCCCGNDYLRSYAEPFCENSLILPTVVDTDVYRPVKRLNEERLVVGWIGSPSTWCNMQPLMPLLTELARERGVRIRVIGAGKEAERSDSHEIECAAWQEETEVEEVQKMDIGIMPLLDQPWQRGKSGYKLIQYMACGLPVVASPVGVNSEIVKEGVNGFLARGLDEWRNALSRLIDAPQLRQAFGSAGRKLAVERYSLEVHAPRLAGVLKAAASAARAGRDW